LSTKIFFKNTIEIKKNICYNMRADIQNMAILSGSCGVNGSCAIKSRELCQVGNQAALSGVFGVPQGSLFSVATVG